MKALKTSLFAGSLIFGITMPAFANETQIAPAQFSEADAQLLFEQDANPMQLATLSQKEMKETEGAVVFLLPVVVTAARIAAPYVVQYGMQLVRNASIGAISGATQYGYDVIINGKPYTTSQLGGAWLGGAVGGVIGGSNPLRAATAGVVASNIVSSAFANGTSSSTSSFTSTVTGTGTFISVH